LPLATATGQPANIASIPAAAITVDLDGQVIVHLLREDRLSMNNEQ